MNLSEALNGPLALGQSIGKGGAQAPSPTRGFKKVRKSVMVQALVFHPDTWTLHEIEIDVANPVQNGAWFPTSNGTLVSHRFVAALEAWEALAATIREYEAFRTFVNKKESQLRHRLFMLAEESRASIVDASMAPVALTRYLPGILTEFPDGGDPVELAATTRVFDGLPGREAQSET